MDGTRTGDVPAEHETVGAPAAADVARAAAADAVARAQGREFASFRCGCALPAGLRAAPEEMREAFRKEVVDRMRATLESAWPGARWDALVPDVIAESRPSGDGARVVFVPLFVAGRYRKLARGLAQTPFLCRCCRGRRASRAACEACSGTGRVVPEAVSDFVVPPLVRAAGGRRGAFHGSGREDVDVRMLGRGRPFVVSVEHPRTRTIDASALAADVLSASADRVEVSDLRVVRRSEMTRLTTDHGVKTYRAVVVPDGDTSLPASSPALLSALEGTDVGQRTPFRVASRRADAIRSKRILGVSVEEASPQRLVAVLRTDPGTYVKELISGDGGRTEPSFASLLGVPCTCGELDVLDVEDVEDVVDVAEPPVTSSAE